MKDRKKDGGSGAGPDPRFAAVQYDPRFQRFPKAKSKVQVDDRFKGMFDDPAFQVGVTVDKRGRKVKGKKRTEDMRRYYRLKDEDEWRKDKEEEKPKSEAEEEEDEEEELAVADKKGKKKAAVPKAVSKKKGGKKKEESSSEEEEGQSESEEEGSEEESGSGSEEDDDEAEQRWARMRGLAGPETSSEEESSEKSDVSDEDGVSDSELALDAEEESLDIEANDDEAIIEFGIGAMAANPREQIALLPDATLRLACVDLDWENIRAVDILVALRSFLPRGGSIEKVTVYPSDYGLERMEAEAKSGPQGIWKQAKKDNVTGGDAGGSGSDAETSKSEEEEEEEVEGEESSDDDSAADGEVDPAKLRLYERSKLRWYYAIVECDSAESANQLYEECDGMELMKSACKFDLRFVPDEQSFEGRQVRDSATEVPSDYEAPTFQTKALQHTNVDLTWDKGDESRKRALTRKLTAEEIKEDDFRAYLATESECSSDEDSEEDVGGDKEDAEAIRERYRRLLLGEGGEGVAKERKGKKDWKKKGGTGDSDGSDSENDSEEEEEDDDKKMEMEVTFSSGLEGLGDRLVAKRKEAETTAGETVWEAYMRRKKEKKAEAKRLGKVNYESEEDEGDYSEEEGSEGGSGSEEELPPGVADDPFFQHEEDPFSDPFFQNGGAEAAADGKKDKKKGKKGKKGATGEEEAIAEETLRRTAELEMLLMDEDALLRAGNGTEAVVNGAGKTGGKLSKKERMRLRKEKKRTERAYGSDDEDNEEAVGAGFKVNLEDPRFKDLLVAPEFALDPTDPRYAKAGPGVAVVAAEVAKRRSKAVGTKKSAEKSEEKVRNGGNGAAGGTSKADLKLMVASLKRKAAAMGPGAGEGGSTVQGKGKKAAKRR